MREASSSRTVTDTDSCAFLYKPIKCQREDDRGKVIKNMSKFIIFGAICLIALDSLAITEKWRTHHIEDDGFEWIEIGYEAESLWSSYAVDMSGNVLVYPLSTETCENSQVIYFPNKYHGIFFRKIYWLDSEKSKPSGRKPYIWEAYSKEGNLLIPKSRGYESIRHNPDPGVIYTNKKYLVVETRDGIGLCDLNGFELAPCEYKEYSYDGYDFEGEKSISVPQPNKFKPFHRGEDIILICHGF